METPLEDRCDGAYDPVSFSIPVHCSPRTYRLLKTGERITRALGALLIGVSASLLYSARAPPDLPREDGIRYLRQWDGADEELAKGRRAGYAAGFVGLALLFGPRARYADSSSEK